ncbi:MAG: AraC family transcriptional regulator [Methylophilaceae bacterium]|uniref:hypothetical protein n=1 Tax=Methylovorus sp. MM2 TaxID=1848038 RepID=UPI0007E1EA7C|nr:hypothetical protein [Methylovorus sp. MM2]OAM52120.1 hypothetical protein A7981_01120 [Methylovorus sp. MM2]
MKKQLPYFLIAFLLPVTAMLWWWGLFSTTTLQSGEYGGYRYVYLDAQGLYSKLMKTQNEVSFQLKLQGIVPGSEVTLVMTDPRTTPQDKLLARTGFLISADAEPKAPLKVDTIAKREVVVAEIKAHPLFAYGKAYSALLDYTKEHKTTLHLPTLEIYDHSVLRVEMPLTSDQVTEVDTR